MATEWISRDSIVAALDMCAVLAHCDIKAGRGTSFRIHCPFHEDDRPSCSVNPEAKVFNCFSCGEQGNVLDFIAGMEDLDPKAEFRSVLESAIKINGHNPTPQKGKRNRSNRNVAKPDGNTKKDAEKNAGADEGKPAKGVSDTNADEGSKAPNKRSRKSNNTRKRAFSNEPDGSLELEPNRVLERPAFPLKLDVKNSWLEEQLQRIGVNRSVAVEFGIGFEARSNALMANRVCFPIHNGDGDLVAYAGRWASDDADEQGRFFTENGREQPRYRLPKGFHKQLELFNWHRVVEQFEGRETVVLVEGFWSVLRLQVMTIPSVALMGLSICDAQIRLLLEGGICSVIVMLDGDDEGQAAMEKLALRLASHFFTRCIVLPDGTKPDDVDLSVLNEVKALCVNIELQPASTPPAKGEYQSGAKRKSAQKRSGKNAAATDKAQSKIERPDRIANDKPNPPTGYALPRASVTASFGWTNID